jgi:hypothetical protein
MGLAYHRPEPWAGVVLRCFANAAEKVSLPGRKLLLEFDDAKRFYF